MSNQISLPDGLEFQRVTNVFTAETVPAGLLKAHRIADGVWGLLKVEQGSVFFIEEVEDGRSVRVGVGDHHVIQPKVPHRVEPSEDARFMIEFYR